MKRSSQKESRSLSKSPNSAVSFPIPDEPKSSLSIGRNFQPSQKPHHASFAGFSSQMGPSYHIRKHSNSKGFPSSASMPKSPASQKAKTKNSSSHFFGEPNKENYPVMNKKKPDLETPKMQQSSKVLGHKEKKGLMLTNMNLHSAKMSMKMENPDLVPLLPTESDVEETFTQNSSLDQHSKYNISLHENHAQPITYSGLKQEISQMVNKTNAVKAKQIITSLENKLKEISSKNTPKVNAIDASALLSRTDKTVLADQTFCVNHERKKAKYVQSDSNEQANTPRYYCSDCAVEAALRNLDVQKIPTLSSVLATEESVDNQSSLLSDFNDTREDNTSKSQKAQREIYKRESEINSFKQQVQEMLKRAAGSEQRSTQDKEQLRANLSSINEKIHTFKAKMIGLIENHTEEMVTSLNLEFGKEMIRLSGFSDSLKGINKGLQDINLDIENNYQRILRNIEEDPYRKIMKKYKDKMKSFEDFLSDAKSFPRDAIKFLPSENVSHYKRRLKLLITGAFTESATEIDEVFKKPEETLTNSPLPQIKSMREFEDFLKSEENKESLKTKAHNPNNIIVSFGSKDIFEMAMQTSESCLPTTNYTQGSQLTTTNYNAFFSEPDYVYDPTSSHIPRIPRLNFELNRGSSIQESPSFSEDVTNSEYKDWSMSSQMMSEGSSLNKYMSLLDKVNQKQNTRNNYLRMGNLYDLGKKNSHFYDHTGFINFIENKLKDEVIRETCQKSLFQSPAFKDGANDTLIY